MQEIDILDIDTRRKLLTEIRGDENKSRKSESFMRFEVYKDRQARYIIERLEEEFEQKTVKEMRKITSINLTPRIIDEMADLYSDSPDRHFNIEDEAQLEQIKEWYHLSEVDRKLNKANRLLKLNDQVILQVVPVKGKIQVRPLLPHQIDVVPDPLDPEQGMVWIVSVFDKHDDLMSRASSTGRNREVIDGINQKIADPDDYKKAKERYEVWSDNYNFMMNGKGEILDEEDIINPLGRAPFIDVASDKDFEFWLRRGNSIVDFSLDFGKILSDTANTIRLQAYAQAVIASEKAPNNLVVGPNQLLHLELDPNKPVQPSFQFVSPNPDIAGSIDFLQVIANLFMTCKGVDPKSIVLKGEAKSYSSGIEKLLSMIESFERSKQDIELFHIVEDKVFNLIKDWVTLYRGQGILDDDYYEVVVSEEADLRVQFKEPDMIQTKVERDDNLIKLVEKGYITKAQALVEMFGMSLEEAESRIEQIKEEKQANLPPALSGAINNPGEDDNASQSTEGDEEGDRADD